MKYRSACGRVTVERLDYPKLAITVHGRGAQGAITIVCEAIDEAEEIAATICRATGCAGLFPGDVEGFGPDEVTS